MSIQITQPTNYYPFPVPGVDVNLWFSILQSIIDKNLPEASENLEPLGQPEDVAGKRAWPWWKLKKWAARIVQHFIQRYGKPEYFENDQKENLPFAEYFRSHMSVQLLAPVMNCLAVRANGRFTTDEVHRSCLTFIEYAVEISPTWKKTIKPHLDFVLFQSIFPSLCLTSDDIELFEEDPLEFIRKINDVMQDWIDPRTAASNLLLSLAKNRAKDTLPRLLAFIEATLAEYNAAPVETRDYRKKDAIFVCIGTIFKVRIIWC